MIQDPNKKTVKPPPGFVEDVPPPPGFVIDNASTPAAKPAGWQVNEALNAWKQPFQQGMERVRRGNPIAGGLRFAQGALQLPFAPVQAAAAGYRSIPVVGPYLAAPFDMAAAVPNAIGGAIDWGTNRINDVIGSPQSQDAAIAAMLNVKPQSITDIADALRDVNKTTGVYLFTPSVVGAVANVPERVGGGLQKLGQRLETKAITPPFSAKKGLETFDRPVETALKGNYGPSRQGVAKLENDLGVLSDKAKEIAAISADRGTTIDLPSINQSLMDVLNKADRSSAYYDETLAAVKDVQSRLGRVAAKYPDGQVPIDVANELKSSFQNLANGKYDQANPPSQVQIGLYKKVGHDLLNQIIQQEPALRPIGLKQRDLIELRPVLERKIASEEKNPIINWRNLREIGLAGGVGALTHEPLAGMATFAAEQALTNPRSLHAMGVAADRTGTVLRGQSFPSLNEILPETFIPTEARKRVIEQMGGPQEPTRLGRLGNLTDKELVEIAQERGFYSNAPQSEAPPSRGGSMGVRGPANAEQIKRFGK